jgi:hypothetical protein
MRYSRWRRRGVGDFIEGEDGPVNQVLMFSQVGSLSVNGSVPVTQSMILRSPVLVVSRLG